MTNKALDFAYALWDWLGEYPNKPAAREGVAAIIHSLESPWTPIETLKRELEAEE